MSYNYLPSFLFESGLFTQIYNTSMEGTSELNLFLEDILNQCFIDSATWGLDLWEEFLSLNSDKSLDYSFRRELIKSKVRGFGVITKQAIKEICEAFALAEVEVKELPNFTFEIKFVGMKGVPPNLEGLKRRVHELKPAHLLVNYVFVYTNWGEVGKLTWTNVKEGTWGDLRVREVN